jgi:hypothetical protein
MSIVYIVICSECARTFALLKEGNPYSEYNAHDCNEVTAW